GLRRPGRGRTVTYKHDRSERGCTTTRSKIMSSTAHIDALFDKRCGPSEAIARLRCLSEKPSRGYLGRGGSGSLSGYLTGTLAALRLTSHEHCFYQCCGQYVATAASVI